ncbi:MAG: alpha/beta hydrolase [Clostridia bacterium]|nr:alpha/beta hydrolase [Clostridia bacterium]
MMYQVLPVGTYTDSTMTLMIHEEPGEARPAVVVFPGGGYRFLSAREADPIARFYYDNGMNVCLLRYSVGEGAKNHVPAIQGGLAVKWMREHAAETNTDPHRIVTCGFSAGGHAAASTGVYWNHPTVRAGVGVEDGAPEGINRPDGMILSYAVLTVGEFTHKGTARHAAGKETLTEEDIKEYSIEQNVDATTPPAFLWHTFTDGAVPVENAIFMMDAMAKVKVPFEAHIFPEGPHGLSLCNELTWEGKAEAFNPHAAVWADLSVKWILDCVK